MLGQDLILSYVLEASGVKDSELSKKVGDLLSSYICNELPYQQCAEQVFKIVGDTKPADKMHFIVTQSKFPPLSEFDENTESILDINAKRKKNHPWTQQEDTRLLCAILKNGLSKWGEIASFVGNGRTRSQCSQRWNRCLDPTIVKDKWTQGDDQKLFDLVDRFGPHAWAKIAQIMETRTDVQCRYRYQLINKKMKAQAKRNSFQKQIHQSFPTQLHNQHQQQAPHPVPQRSLSTPQEFIKQMDQVPSVEQVTPLQPTPAVETQNEGNRVKDFDYQNAFYAKLDSIWEQLFSNEQMLNFSF